MLNPATLTTILQNIKSLNHLKQLHCIIITSPLNQHDLTSHLLTFASSKPNTLDYAYTIFLNLKNPTTFNYNTIIRAFAKTKNPNMSIEIFKKMLCLGLVPDYLTYPVLLKAASRLSEVRVGFSVHGRVVKHGLECDRFVRSGLIHFGGCFRELGYARKVFDEMFDKNLVSWNSMLDCYLKCRELELAREVFGLMPEKDVVSWSCMVDGCVKCGEYGEAWEVFREMCRKGVEANEVTMVSALGACAHLGEVRVGFSVHGRVVKHGLECDRFVRSSLIHFGGCFNELGYARKVFDEMFDKNLVLWNSMLDCYLKCGELELAREVFGLMPEKDVVSWSCVVDGCVKCGEYGEALEVFREMCGKGVEANEVTMVSVLGACAHLGALEQGVLMHRYIVEKRIGFTLGLRTALVEMYAKCGAIDDALVVFREACKKETDVLIWTAMIRGLATHGFSREALDMFTEMQNTGITPDEITYICILSACAHGGLVKEACYYFNSLAKNNMYPKTEHYTCMIDVLARSGQLTQAYKFLSDMPMEPTAYMLGALFNGCIKHMNLDLAEVVGKKLVELDPGNDRYVDLSNVYAVIGRWDEARAMRETMEKRGVKKSPGWSFVEIINSQVHSS